MGDIRIVWDPATGTGDFVMVGSGLDLGNELESAVLISLFSDHFSDPEDILPPGQSDDPRGWWADTYEQDAIGSKFWQAFWRQTTPDTLNWARDEVAKRLQWMIDDGVAAAIEPNANYFGKGGLAVGALITEPGGKRTPYVYAWAQEV